VKILDFAPHSRDTLTRGCLIFPRGCGTRIAHAKSAKVAEIFYSRKGR